MSSAVHFRFKSARDFDTVTFDGDFISIADLKVGIVEVKKLNYGEGFDLDISDAQTSDDYADEAYLLPKNTSVVVRRVPGLKPGGILSQQAMAKKNERYSEIDKRGQSNIAAAAAAAASAAASAVQNTGMLPDYGSAAATYMGGAAPKRVAGQEEHERIAALVDASGAGFERTSFPMHRGGFGGGYGGGGFRGGYGGGGGGGGGYGVGGGALVAATQTVRRRLAPTTCATGAASPATGLISAPPTGTRRLTKSVCGDRRGSPSPCFAPFRCRARGRGCSLGRDSLLPCSRMKKSLPDKPLVFACREWSRNGWRRRRPRKPRRRWQPEVTTWHRMTAMEAVRQRAGRRWSQRRRVLLLRRVRLGGMVVVVGTTHWRRRKSLTRRTWRLRRWLLPRVGPSQSSQCQCRRP